MSGDSELYEKVLSLYRLVICLLPVLLLVDAPHGRFSPSEGKLASRIFTENLTVDGTISWILMELPSPLALIYCYLNSPLRLGSVEELSSPPAPLLVALFLLHYLNRAVISPLRTVSRSRAHIAIPIAAILFNLANGGLMGAWLGSGILKIESWYYPSFWIGICLFLGGWIGNIYHDEVLLSIRRRSESGEGPRYDIPHGGLYTYISYPNYFCEWLEWTGFAIACTAASAEPIKFDQSPPWLFVINEFAVMAPRACK
ncbi:hypothetical protein FRC02_004719 [Tulasnella sp. 418]|nr:hypothetical protein FRC02_004719 [Tulasnella sp. 418]